MELIRQDNYRRKNFKKTPEIIKLEKRVMQEKGDITHGLEDVSDLQKSKWAPIAFAILKMRAKSFKRILKNFDEFRKEPTEEDVEVKFSIGGKTRSSKLMNSN